MDHRYKLIILSLLYIFCLGASAQAKTSNKEFSIIAKVISLSRDIPAGDATFAVIYDPSSAISNAELTSIKLLISTGYKAPRHTFKFLAVPIENISNVTAPILFMTEGLSDEVQQQVMDKGLSNKSLTVTTNITYVKNGMCVLGIDLKNNAKIIIHGAAYQASQLNFDAAFKFIIKEI